ncbi:MAG TPA: hypothetical protein VFJ46_17840 [Xanthobacteraceae bacterium]|nr:hypothetical protein [Xanthobacteraceae bacterium]
MPAPTITAAPPPPLRSQNPATFTTLAENFVDWMAGAPDEFNALAAYLQSLESGTLSALLNAISVAGSAANKLAYYTGPNAVVLADFTAAGRALLDDADASAQLTTLGFSAFIKTLVDDADAATARATLGAAAATPSIQSITASATVTPTFSDDMVKITAQAAGLTLANWSGTPYGGWGMAIRIKDNGTARSITYGSKYRAIGVTLPTTTVANKTLYLGCIYNSDDDKIDVVAVAQEA